MCYLLYSPASEPVAITQIDGIEMPGIHHLVVYQAFGVDEDPAPHECDSLIKETWLPIFGTGTEAQSLALPAGVGFVIQPGTQYIMQIHMLNATDSPITVRGGVNFTYDTNVTGLQQAGIFALGDMTLDIPPNSTDYQDKVLNCTPGYDQMNVFAVFPHMHLLGTELDVTHSVTTEPATDYFTVAPWVFGAQPLTAMTNTFGPTDTFNLTCHYNNPSSTDVVYGESSTNEMCYFILFYYPFQGLNGCVTGT